VRDDIMVQVLTTMQGCCAAASVWRILNRSADACTRPARLGSDRAHWGRLSFQTLESLDP